MVRGLLRAAHAGDDAPVAAIPRHATARRPPMTWQTPTATDFRFGFEITLYVAAR